MNWLCLRVDLDYVPWDTPDAQDFGHGEPAMVLRMLGLAEELGSVFHFFASNRVLRAFPATIETILRKGHPVDWLCKHPSSSARQQEALELFRSFGEVPDGLATRTPWPDGLDLDPALPFRFLSSPTGPTPKGLAHYPVETKGDREAMRSGTRVRAWCDRVKQDIRDASSRRRSLTVCVRPQVLAAFDPQLHALRELVAFAPTVDLPLTSLRKLQ